MEYHRKTLIFNHDGSPELPKSWDVVGVKVGIYPSPETTTSGDGDYCCASPIHTPYPIWVYYWV
jgi:hypothetical protein